MMPLIGFSTTIKYELSFPEPQTHYVEVKMIIEDFNESVLDLKMPVWAPGSYLVREFSKHVESLNSKDKDGQLLSSVKLNKNTWRIETKGSKNMVVSYKVYAYELSVRTSFIDEEHAYLNGTSIFMYNDLLLSNPVTVKINPHSSWKKISVALERVKISDNWQYKADNYDELVDAPFEIGNHVTFSFVVAGVPHEVAMFGTGNYDSLQIKRDFTIIAEECSSIFGEHPCKQYLYIIHNLNAGGGGLEHANSTTLQTNRWSYGTGSSYTDFLSLVAHEYFHIWNVKRLRPAPLGPFDYSNENYTTMLWIAEGFTAYYDDLIIRRSGFISDVDYLKIIAGNMSYCMNIKGAAIQPLSESSLDAWIKYYRPYENSGNATVSYYTKGGVVGALLDMEIMKSTNGSKSLDDVMKEMYQQYYKKLNRPFTESEFVAIVNKVAGRDMSDFFKKYVHSTTPLPLQESLAAMGLEIMDLNTSQSVAWTGATTTSSNSKMMVTAVERNSPAWKYGINVNDEILAVDKFRVGDDLSKLLSFKKPGETVTFTVSRNGSLKEIKLVLEKSSAVKYAIEKSASPQEAEKMVYKKWLKL